MVVQTNPIHFVADWCVLRGHEDIIKAISAVPYPEHGSLFLVKHMGAIANMLFQH